MKKLVIAMVLLVVLLTACGPKEDGSQQSPTVKDDVYHNIPLLPIGEYPAKEPFCTYASSPRYWACSVLADPNGTGTYRLYSVSPLYLKVTYGMTDGYVTVKYEDVLLHLPE